MSNDIQGYNEKKVKAIVERALEEDIRSGDITTENLVYEDSIATAEIWMKESGVIAGLDIAGIVFSSLDDGIEFARLVEDGDKLEKGDIVAEVKGPTKAILEGERVALNFIQRLSGIATNTREYVHKVADLPVKVVDTRKTTPGLRILEKYAVRVGGGYNHRMGLYDAVLIKDNHISLRGGITDSIIEVKDKVPHTAKIEVEVEDISGVEEALEAGADIIMLDNMDIEDMEEAVELVGDETILEASGGITKENIEEIAEAGVDVISVGALTHHIRSLDISLDISSTPSR